MRKPCTDARTERPSFPHYLRGIPSGRIRAAYRRAA
jgi:hypothetical protein